MSSVLFFFDTDEDYLVEGTNGTLTITQPDSLQRIVIFRTEKTIFNRIIKPFTCLDVN
jgi:hypothetical protein